MAQQTAVEWLAERLIRMIPTISPMYKYDIKEFVEQAKAMEQQQIKDAVIYGLDEDGHTGDWKIKFVNDYYNKTFKS